MGMSSHLHVKTATTRRKILRYSFSNKLNCPLIFSAHYGNEHRFPSTCGELNTGTLKIIIIIRKIYFIRGATAKIGPRSPLLRFLGHTIRRKKPLGLLWPSDQPIAEDTTTQQTNIHVLRGTRTHIPNKEATADTSLRPHDHRDSP